MQTAPTRQAQYTSQSGSPIHIIFQRTLIGQLACAQRCGALFYFTAMWPVGQRGLTGSGFECQCWGWGRGKVVRSGDRVPDLNLTSAIRHLVSSVDTLWLPILTPQFLCLGVSWDRTRQSVSTSSALRHSLEIMKMRDSEGSSCLSSITCIIFPILSIRTEYFSHARPLSLPVSKGSTAPGGK